MPNPYWIPGHGGEEGLFPIENLPWSDSNNQTDNLTHHPSKLISTLTPNMF